MPEDVKTPEPQGNNGTAEPNGAAVKTFTQEEVDRVVKDRLFREKQQRDNDPEYKAFVEWKKTQKTEAEKQAEREKEFIAVKNENAMLKAEKKVIKANVKPEFAEFVAAKVMSLGDDFDKNLNEYKKNNPHFFGETVVKKVSSAPSLGGKSAAETTNQKMNDLIRGTRN